MEENWREKSAEFFLNKAEKEKVMKMKEELCQKRLFAPEPPALVCLLRSWILTDQGQPVVVPPLHVTGGKVLFFWDGGDSIAHFVCDQINGNGDDVSAYPFFRYPPAIPQAGPC